VKAEGLVAADAVEMDVEVIVIGPGSVAKLIAHAVSGVFQHVDKMSVPEYAKRTEDAAFVYGFKEALQLHQ
jgi:electron transfer flavoprotein alpha subunit